MDIYEEFFKIIRAFNEAGIRHAVVGGIALSFYTKPRYTQDINLLLVPEEMEKAKALLRMLGYVLEAPPWKFKKTGVVLHRLSKIEQGDTLMIDLLEGNEAEHRKILDNAVSEVTEHGEVYIAAKDDLIWLKRIRSSKQDLADIEMLENEQD